MQDPTVVQTEQEAKSSHQVASLDPRLEELQEAFRAELDDHTRSFNQLLMRLERETSEEGRVAALDTLFREAHSLKGAAICVEFGLVEGLADALQLALEAARRAGSQTSAAWFDAVYQSVDVLAPLYRSSLEGRNAPTQELLDALGALERVSPGALSVPAKGKLAVPPGRTTRAARRRMARRVVSSPSPAVVAQNASQLSNDASPQPRQGSIRVAVSKLDELRDQTVELATSHLPLEQGLKEDRKSTRLNSSHIQKSRMPSSA